MKAYTDIEQSKSLAEILPLKSADMEYMFLKKDSSKVSNVPFVKDGFEEPECCYIFIPCWSLAALLEIISYPTLSQEYGGKWSCMEFPGDEEVEGCENPVDACVEMILNLYEKIL